MAQPLTLEQLTPRVPFAQKALSSSIWTLLAVVLVASWIWTGIQPGLLIEKRENAYTYLFGRNLTVSEMEDARQRAERFPALMAYEEAMNEMRQKAASGHTFRSSLEMQQEARKLSEERLARMPEAEKERIAEEEFSRLTSGRRGGFFPPETSPVAVKGYLKALTETVAIAIWGSLFAVLASIPASILAAANTLEILVPGESAFRKSLRHSLRFSVRRLLDFCRGFNEFVMALIFVAVIGLGPFAGVMALAIHTFGILGKVISEGIEAIEPGQVEAVNACGASPLQVVSFGVLPQVMPLIVSYSLLRFESNVRSATILGFVGAGGIGFLMYDKINGYLYREVCTMMILVILSVILIDALCTRLRRRFI